MAELPERLREAADAHRPDRARILARVERAMAAPGTGAPRRREGVPAPWMRVAAVTAAVAGAIGLGGLAVAAVTGDTAPGHATVTAGSSTGPTGSTTPDPDPGQGSGTSGIGASRGVSYSPTAHGTPRHGHHGGATHKPGTPAGGSPATSTPTGSAHGSAPGSPGSGGAVRDNGVSVTGTVDGSSNPYWTQSDITLTLDRPLTSLAVELRVARTSGVASTGSYDSISGQTTVSITVQGDYLVYHWALNPGQTLPAGTYAFAGQFQHDEGDRDAGGDSYSAAGEGPGGTAAVTGGF
jgi:hypothetical protein